MSSAYSTRVSWKLFLAQFTLLEIWKRHVLQHSIQTGSSNTMISKCFSVNLNTDSLSYWWKQNAQSTSWWHYAFIHLPTLPQTNIKSLEEVMLTRIERRTPRRPYNWQKDTAPCHTSRKTDCWPSEIFCNHISSNIWPPNSPECNFIIIMYGVQLNEKPTKFRVTLKINWRQG